VSAVGPDVGVVAQAVNSAIDTAVKMIRRKGCIFMVAILPGND
jgi:hypothetical protein